jgi:raffinose/stachyose/melibiose transport system permease protein
VALQPAQLSTAVPSVARQLTATVVGWSPAFWTKTVLPSLALLLVFNYLPALIGLSRAFTHWETGESPRFSGFENFAIMMRDEFLRISVGNQVLLLLLNLVKTLTMPLLVAELLVSLRAPRWQYALRTAFILPMVVPGMVSMLLWAFIYDGSIGILNQLLEQVHLGGLTRSWLGESSTALLALAGIGFPWAGGLALLIYLAGLTAIPTDVWDSCDLDGATGWRRVWSVDLPLLRPQVSLLATLTIIGTLQDFGSILILTAGGPGLATHVPALHMYFQAFRFGHFGYASAIGFVLFAVIFALSALNQSWGKRLEKRF